MLNQRGKKLMFWSQACGAVEYSRKALWKVHELNRFGE
jgi:hypothetical protein